MGLIGFSRLLGKSAEKFIPLDKTTNGACGRPIYIDVDLSRKFSGIEPGHIAMIMQKLKQLSATAGGMSSYSSLDNAMEHMTVIGSIRVNYKMFQNTNDPGKKAGVYITDVDTSSFIDGEPGLRKIKHNRGEWVLNEGKPSNIDGHYAAINGLCRDSVQAATEILPDMLKEAYKDKKWPGDLNSEGFNMFYNPPSLYVKGLRFKTPKQKKTSLGHTADLLRDVMLQAQNNSKPVHWVVHSDGAKLFAKTLEKLSGKDMSNHTVLFCAPMADVSKLLPMMKQSKMNLHDDVMAIGEDDWRSKSVQMRSGPQIKQQLTNYPGLEQANQKARIFASSARDDLFVSVGNVTAAATIGFGVGTLGVSAFLMAPFTGGLSVGGVIAGGLAAASKVKTIQSMRNSAATNLKDASLNPHMHPFKSSKQMNAHLEEHSGSMAKTFWDIIKAKSNFKG